MHPAFSNGFLIEIQYTAIVFNRAQRAPVEVFSMHPAFSNGFLIEIQYTAIVFNRAQRAPASHGWFSINAVPEILILVPFFGGGGAPPINKVLGLCSNPSALHYASVSEGWLHRFRGKVAMHYLFTISMSMTIETRGSVVLSPDDYDVP